MYPTDIEGSVGLGHGLGDGASWEVELRSLILKACDRCYEFLRVSSLIAFHGHCLFTMVLEKV
jgi:hypothetical protein